MALTYALINKITVGSGGAANIEFTSIPQTYTDLICHFSLREGTSTGVSIQFNSSSATYANQRLYSSGSSITADTFSTSDIVPNSGVDSTYTSNVFGNGMIYIPSYTTAEQKAVIAHGSAENNASSPAFLMLISGKWDTANAITSIKLSPYAGTWSQYSSATLYGIKNS